MENQINERLNEICDFLENDEGQNKDELVADLLLEIKELRSYEPDEITLIFGSEEIMTLEEFTDKFHSLLNQKICNAIKSFKER